jgi:hypothetical protein
MGLPWYKEKCRKYSKPKATVVTRQEVGGMVYGLDEETNNLRIDVLYVVGLVAAETNNITLAEDKLLIMCLIM